MTPTLPLYLPAARITLDSGPALLRTMLLVQVLAGAIGLATGCIALHAAKGSALQVVVLAAASDVRVIRGGGLHGRPRLVRLRARSR